MIKMEGKQMRNDEGNPVSACFSAADADAMGRRYELDSIEKTKRWATERLEGKERARKFLGRLYAGTLTQI
ncbi:MAG TPA: hypothetical protein VMV79_06005 [Alphaproteobacteria bacterium]|nr:hypothetical protein [Alphaproteobacteria bacterium]